MKGCLRNPANQQACRATVQMEKDYRMCMGKVSPENDKIGKNTDDLENSTNGHLRYLMKHLGEKIVMGKR